MATSRPDIKEFSEMRKATVKRDTKETKISLSLDLDGTGEGTIDTGIGFFNHMLELSKSMR